MPVTATSAPELASARLSSGTDDPEGDRAIGAEAEEIEDAPVEPGLELAVDDANLHLVEDDRIGRLRDDALGRRRP